MICERCGKESFGHIISMFNTQDICFDCKEKERAHPLYAKAVEADNEAILGGNWNFEGIGLPIELEVARPSAPKNKLRKEHHE